MIVVGPGYLNERSLPYASDVFYHGRLLYFLPTGFHPLELHSVAQFPEYCAIHSVPMPSVIWEMCRLYFQNSGPANTCLEVLEPLIQEHITVAVPSYPRGRYAVERAQALLCDHPLLLTAFADIDIDMRFVSRELLSHVLFEIFIEEGFRGAIAYLNANGDSPQKLVRLVAAILLNRLKIFANRQTKLLVYEHTWYPFMHSALDLLSGEGTQNDHAFKVEHFRYKLFETILLPIFGKCDSKRKSELAAKTAQKRERAIVGLKEQCEIVAREVVLLPTQNEELRQKVLADEIKTRISEPLADLIRKPQRDVLNLLRDFTLDSTVIGGLLASAQGATGAVLGLAATAGAVATGVKYLISEEQGRLEKPSQLLLDGMRKARLDEESVQKHLRSISVDQLRIPDEWESIT